MEKNVNQQPQKEAINIGEVFSALRKHLVLMLAIVIAFIAFGAVYGSMQKRTFTVTQKIVYKCQNLPYFDKNGNLQEPTTTANTNTMLAYGDTIIDLFDEGVVLDRANYYYKEYANAKLENSDLKLEDFFAKLEVNDNYVASQEQRNVGKNIFRSNLNTYGLTDENETKFAFAVSYTDMEAKTATEKLNILVYAFTKECGETIENSEGELKIKYFGEFTVIIADLGEESITTNVSKTKTLIMFTAIGVVVALLTVYVLSMIDNTVKNNEEVERLTGAPVLSTIEDVEDKHE